MTEEKTEQRNNHNNIIYIGKKPPMNYVLAVITQFNDNGFCNIILKARGKSISTAVDTAEILRNRFMKNVSIKEIKIGTENVITMNGKPTNVSSIDIELTSDKKKR